MKENMTKKQNNTLYLLIENKFGALERILNTFTLRGFKVENMVYSQNKNAHYSDIKICINCLDSELERLIKILHNQIHVIEIRLILDEKLKSFSFAERKAG